MRHLLIFTFCITFFSFAMMPVQASSLKYHQVIKQRSQLKAPGLIPTEAKLDQKYTIIIAPHPDDEILCCSRVIAEAVAKTTPLKIIYLTDGDARTRGNSKASRYYGAIRRAESTRATRSLGVNKSDLIWLGFPDGVLADLGKTPLVSPYSFRTKTGEDTYQPGTTYTAQNLQKILQELLKIYPPNAIYFPDENRDQHPDHVTAGHSIWNLIGRTREAQHHYRYVIHTSDTSNEIAPFDFQKSRLIDLFQSQFHDAGHRQFLQRFAYRAERFE